MKIVTDMAKVQIKSEILTPFGGIFAIMERFDALLGETIDSTLGLRCTSFSYQYSEIIGEQTSPVGMGRYVDRVRNRLCHLISYAMYPSLSSLASSVPSSTGHIC